ncbi:MAG: hypothetical protein RIS92_1145 [Verrucomicrobiota bacterium]
MVMDARTVSGVDCSVVGSNRTPLTELPLTRTSSGRRLRSMRRDPLLIWGATRSSKMAAAAAGSMVSVPQNALPGLGIP